MNKWYGADELRQSWCLLCVETVKTDSEVYIQACEIGDGNAGHLIDTETVTAGESNEEGQLLQALGAKLDERRYSGVTLITPRCETLAILRTRFLTCDRIKQPTFRGFNHVALAELLDAYFADDWTGQCSSLIDRHVKTEPSSEHDRRFEFEDMSVEALWKTRTAIGPLVPPDAIWGTPL